MAKKTAKAAKPAKESKTGAGGANFFQLHIEKILLGLIAMVMAYLVYDGMGTSGVAQNKSPQNLTQTAASALESVKVDHSKEIMQQPERQYKVEFSDLARNSRSPTVEQPYATDPWEISPRSISEKRGDPALLAPINLQVVTGYGAMAINVKQDAVDAFAEFEDADAIKGKKKPRESSSRRPAGGGRGGSGGSSGMMPGGSDGDDMDGGDMDSGGGIGMGGPMGSGMGMDGGRRRLNPAYDKGFGGSRGAQGGLGMMGPMGGSDGGDLGDLGAPAMSSGGRGSMGAPSAGGPTGGGANTRGKGEKLGHKSVYFNVVSGLAPHKALVEEYKKAFEESAGFNAMRDRPHYLSFIAERVDVTADPNKEPAEGDWKKVADLRQQEKLVADEWAGTNSETANTLYTDPALTIAPLPILIRDYRALVAHPDIPESGRPMVMNETEETDGDEKKDETEENEDDQFSSRRRNNAAGNNMLGGAGGIGMPTGGSGSPMMGMPTPGGPGGRGAMMGGMDDGGDLDGSGSSGMMGGIGGPMGGNLFGGSTTTLEAEADYKLVRFFDFGIQAGHVYRYRIRLVIEDPNYPEERSLDPDLSILKNEVFTRVVGMRAEDEKKPANKEGVKPRTFYRFTDWSVASAPAYAPYPGMFANSAVTISKRSMKLTGSDNTSTTIEVDSSPRGPVGNIVFADWDANLGIDVPSEYEVQKGSLLFFNTKEKEPEVVDPVSKGVKKYKGYKMNEAIAVVDVRGGESLGHNDDRLDKLALNGEVMVFRNDGSLDVCSELDDQDAFRMFTFADEKEQAERASAPAAGGGAPMGGIGAPMGGREGGRGER